MQATWLRNGHVLITDQANERIIEVTPTKQIVWQYGKTGDSGSDHDQLNNPDSAELLPNGNILIADENNNRAMEVTEGLLYRTERRDRVGDIKEGHHHPPADHPKTDPPGAIRVDRRQGPGATAGRSIGVLTWSPTRLTQKAADRFIGRHGSQLPSFEAEQNLAVEVQVRPAQRLSGAVCVMQRVFRRRAANRIYESLA